MTETFLTEDLSKALNKAIASSCRILAIREHSEKQLRLKLQKKAYSQATISICVSYLRKENWISDERFCNAFIRSRVEKGQGLRRILHELNQQEIENDVVQEQLECENIDWQAMCERVLLKKLRQAITEPFVDVRNYVLEGIKLADRKKLESFLWYRGFSSEEINKAFIQIPTIEDPPNINHEP